jgi:xanthine dehydrogenase YagS FAD-binding subunit
MTPFDYRRAESIPDAIHLAGSLPQAKYLGGGTNLVDLMRETIERPRSLVDVTNLSHSIEARGDGSILIGAAAKNTAVAADRTVRERLPMLSRAILAGASAQIRNMATVGGNILQRTRCSYFYDDAARCNKRTPGTGCDAIDGFNRMHAILGASPACVATHPSDMCVAMVALDAVLHLDGPQGGRQVELGRFLRLPGARPDIETELQPGELITAVEIPALAFGPRSTYRKVRDRASYAFALVSVGAALDITEGGTIRDLRIAIGGVAHRPWRAARAEADLRGRSANREAFRAAAEVELADAVALRDNGFKIELAKRTIVAVLSDLSGDLG